jgi:transposase
MEPMARPGKYAPELRERAVRMVFEHADEYPSQWAAMRSVAEKLGCTTEALRRWVRQAERDLLHAEQHRDAKRVERVAATGRV